LIPDFQALKAYPNHIETKGSSNIETMGFDQRKLFPGENGRKKTRKHYTSPFTGMQEAEAAADARKLLRVERVRGGCEAAQATAGSRKEPALSRGLTS